jgi:hypothetical protein
MRKYQLLTSSASGALIGALLFGATPASAQIAVFDWANNAVETVIKGIEQTMSSTLSNITKQLETTGPLGTLLGSAENGSATTLLQQGIHPERQLHQSRCRRAEPDRRWRADFERPLSA